MIRCDHCGHTIQHECRNEIGKGTWKAKNLSMNNNRKKIVNAIKMINRPCSIRDIQSYLFNHGINRESKRNAGWNYHTVQADVSNLIGMGVVSMVRPIPKKVFDSHDGHTTRSIPLYVLNNQVGVLNV